MVGKPRGETPRVRQGEDRREDTFKMEPLLVEGRGELADLALDLAQKAAGLKRSLPAPFVVSLADLVRAMNCYYSNLIEGHDTRPIDIERALRKDYSKDKKKRDLQREAVAHIAVQQWIDAGGLSGPAASIENIREIHRRFCQQLPPDLLWVEDPTTKGRSEVVPGALRQNDVVVGRHVAISPGAVPRFLARYADVYGKLGKADTIVAAAAAHHRLAWIHPFADGNGRVARLLSHAMLLHALDSGAIWSVARGLARSVESYKGHLQACDEPRRGDRDGRGNLSEQALLDFTRYFLETCIDQVDFMERLVQPDKLHARILGWARDEVRRKKLLPRSVHILEIVLARGQMHRDELRLSIGTGDRQLRRTVSELLELGVLTSEGQAAPVKLGFPAALAPQWMPGLFPEGA